MPTESFEVSVGELVRLVSQLTRERDGRSFGVVELGKRVVVFSGGEAKDLDGVYEEVRGIRDGGANGSIIGRNTFQRPKELALEMLNKVIDIYLGKA